MEYKKLFNLFLAHIIFLSPLAVAAAETPVTDEQSEVATEALTADEVSEGEQLSEEVVADEEEEGPQGITVEPGTPFEVPALIDRPLDIEEGPYVRINAFNLIDAEDYPEHEVSIDEINNFRRNFLWRFFNSWSKARRCRRLD